MKGREASDLTITTVNTTGRLQGVRFAELDLFNSLTACPEVNQIYCKHGEKTWGNVKINRKKPGHFNSQITFILSRRAILGELTDDIRDRMHVSMFVNGSVQVPGMLPGFIPSTIRCIEWLGRWTAKQMKTDPTAVKLMEYKAVMYNYKWRYNLENDEVLNYKLIVDVFVRDSKLPNSLALYADSNDEMTHADFMYSSDATDGKASPVKIRLYKSGKTNMYGRKSSYTHGVRVYDEFCRLMRDNQVTRKITPVPKNAGDLIAATLAKLGQKTEGALKERKTARGRKQ